VRLPLGYCLPLWRDPQGVPLVDLRAGLSVGRTVARDVTDQGEAP